MVQDRLVSTDPEVGLSAAEAADRLKHYGPNEIEESSESQWHRILRRFWGPIPWMIEISALLSAAIGRWEDFIIILIMLLVNASVDYYQEYKALSAIEILKKKLAHYATVLRDGQYSTLPAREIVPGDIVKVKIGDIVPADIILAKNEEYVQVDQSALTGESLPVRKGGGEILYANAIIKQGEMRGEVIATGLQTYFGKTVGLVAKAEEKSQSHLQKMVLSVGHFLIAMTIVIILVILAVGIARHEPLSELLLFSLVLTISAIPVAMPAVLTVTMSIGAGVLAKGGAIVSRLSAIEELAGMDILCSDKTGTLTQNTMTISDPYTSGEFSILQLLTFAAMASEPENRDPIELPIFSYLDLHGGYEDQKGWRRRAFVPFDPVRKRSEVTIEQDGRTFYTSKGAPQVVIELCRDTLEEKKKAYERVDDYARKGFRTLAVAVREKEEDEFRLVGLIPLYDPPRSDSEPTLTDVKAKGVNVKMVTGDNIAVAQYIASLLGIGDHIENVRDLKGEGIEEYLQLAGILSRALTKSFYPSFSPDMIEEKVQQIVTDVKKEYLDLPLPKGSVKRHESEIIALIEQADGFAQVFPEDKYFIVEELQKADHIVGMTGDGVNDAPALKKADVGIAVSGATDAARAAADIVLTSPGLGVISEAITHARMTFGRMKSYTVFRIAETIRIIGFMALSIVIFQFYPVTALMIIVLALLNDIPILTIAYDRANPAAKPIRWEMGEMLVMAGWLGMAGLVSSFLLFWILIKVLLLPVALAQAIFFTKMVVAGHGTIYNTRTDGWFWMKPYPSWTLFLATFSSRIAGTVIAVYGFGLMEPVGWGWAAAVWAYAMGWMVFNDVVKIGVLRYHRKRKQGVS